MNSHFHTHVNTHFCGCGRTHIHAHTHVHTYPLAEPVATPKMNLKITIPVEGASVAKRTRSRMARSVWESEPLSAQDQEIVRRLDFLRNSDDPWERSLVPEVENDAIQQSAKRAKITVK